MFNLPRFKRHEKLECFLLFLVPNGLELVVRVVVSGVRYEGIVPTFSYSDAGSAQPV